MHSIRQFFRRELRGKLRVWGSWLLVPLILINIHQEPAIAGILVIAFGALLRTWASGTLRKESTLCTEGPYKFSRNPLYLGSILIVVGVPISQNQWWLSLFLFLASAFLIRLIIGAEEQVLKEKFGQAYALYCQRVRRFFSFPAFVRTLYQRARGVRDHSFNFALWKKNKGWEPLLVSASVVLVTYLVAELQEHIDLPSTASVFSKVF